MPYGRSGQVPQAIALTPGESALVAKVNFHPDLSGDREEFLESAAAAAQLTKSLTKRNAIPQHRLDYFTDPRYNIGTKKSRQEVFESNGTSGEAILEHPHFLKYLHYFIYGPDPPVGIIEGFCRIVREDRGTSGEVMTQLHRYVRRCVRDGLDRLDAADEFFKLAIECGLGVDWARGVRKAAMTAK